MMADNSGVLAQQAHALQLMIALDRVRDSIDDDQNPGEMLTALVALLAEHFSADVCALLLLAETSDDVEWIAVKGVTEPVAIRQCRAAIAFETPTPLPVSPWVYTLGHQLKQHGLPLGGLILGRSSHPFSDEEIALLEIAEKQLDSAIMQAHTIWKLQQRNRELEAIFEIDRLRDGATSESELINGFATILVEHFEVGLAMIIVHNDAEAEPLLRGLIDRYNLPTAALQAIRASTAAIEIPQTLTLPPELEIQDMCLLAAPLIVAERRLGAVVLGRQHPFSIGDHRLLYAVNSQIDSAILHRRTQQQLQRRTKELETIYTIDRIRDQETDFDVMLQRILATLCQAVSGELGFIMLYGQHETVLETRAVTAEGLLTSAEYQATIQQIARQALDTAEPVYTNALGGAVRSVIAVPLILKDRKIGVFGAVNSTNARGFSNEDRQILAAITSQVDTAVFERIEQRRMRTVLSRSVGPKVLEHLLGRADASVLAGERFVVSALYADLRGSTRWAERVPADELVSTLNAFFAAMTEIIFGFDGMLDKFVGDQVIGLFGAPLHDDDHALKAAHAALQMQHAHQVLQEQLGRERRELPPMGIGISSGEVIVGEFGAPTRTNFTAIGRQMNLGARLCNGAAPSQILISEAT
ncbi:MAG: GAF domain-containing protein, partial [Chloroflexi bacterium]|nr:GAF domain-containing protein [Chloroflexota bacterium]